MIDFSRDEWTLAQATELFSGAPVGCWQWNTESGESIIRDCAVEFFRNGTGRFYKFHVASGDDPRYLVEGTFAYESAGKASIRVRVTSPGEFDGQSAVVNYLLRERRSVYGGRVLQIAWSTPALECDEKLEEAWPFHEEMDWVRTETQ